MNRKELIKELINLSSDEFNAEYIIYLNKKELMQLIINCAHYYKNEIDNT